MREKGNDRMNYVYVDWETMESFVNDVFLGYGIPAEDARICTDVLLESDRRGIESH
jgi:LDH2 family malate/lactate/ureidoglycolate dehydrogenase